MVAQQHVGNRETLLNVGVVTHCYLVPANQLSFRDATLDQPATLGDMALTEAGIIFELRFTAGQCTFSESYANSVYSPAIDITLSGHSAELTTWQQTNRSRRWVALLRQADGQCWIAGTPDNGLRQGFSRSVGMLQLSKLNLTTQTWHPAWPVPALTLDELAGIRDFSILDFSPFDFHA